LKANNRLNIELNNKRVIRRARTWEAGLANIITDYPFSSARNYAGIDAILNIIIESQQQVKY